NDGDASNLANSIIATILSSKNGKSMELKELRTAVLTTDDAVIDKSSKKLFKSAVKLLEKDERVSLNAEGIVKLSKSERAKSKSADEEAVDDEPKSEQKKKKKKEKKRKRESKENDIDLAGEEDDDSGENTKKTKQMSVDVEESQDNDDDEEQDTTNYNEESQNSNDNNNTSNNEVDPADKNKPCKNNPQGITRLFLGNLPFAISEPTLNTHLKDCVTHIKWITDKTTGKFYGSAFIEVRTSKDAATCMSKSNGSMLMGRPLKINYAPMRPGEEGDWPPRSRVITGGKVANAAAAGTGGQAGGSGIKAMSVKPEGCSKLFIGNLSYDIDDEGITKFFMGVEAELKSVRWLHHKDSGDFKGW
ncbi:hypothetical protein ACHAXR_000770, partial [Thalassiosira sp. AJA248-18]